MEYIKNLIISILMYLQNNHYYVMISGIKVVNAEQMKGFCF